MKKRVVMTGTLGVMNEASIAMIKGFVEERADVEFEFLFDAPQTGEDEKKLIEAAKGAEVLITQYQFMTESLYDALLPELKAVIAYGVGYNSANLPVATEKGVYVINVPDYCMEEVALHVVTLILAMVRRIPNLERWVREGNWGGGYKAMAPVKRFSTSTVGIYGYGRIGQYVGKFLSGFGCRIIAFDAVIPDEDIRAAGAEPVDFETLLAESDILTLQVPLIPQTARQFTLDVFKKMKPSAIFVNTSRGALTIPDDLYTALTTGEIAYAAIDAYETEPPQGIEEKIKELPNVLSTPHVGYYSDDALVELMVKTAEEAARVVKGERPKNLVNKTLWKD